MSNIEFDNGENMHESNFVKNLEIGPRILYIVTEFWYESEEFLNVLTLSMFSVLILI